MKDHAVGLGPCQVAIYPPKAYSKLPPEVKMEDLWKLVGPTVEKNLNKLPLWKVFAIVYFEGLSHGFAGAEQQNAAQATSSVEKTDVKPKPGLNETKI